MKYRVYYQSRGINSDIWLRATPIIFDDAEMAELWIRHNNCLTLRDGVKFKSLHDAIVYRDSNPVQDYIYIIAGTEE